MAPFHGKRVTPEKVLAFLMVGFGIGTVVGYVFMATAHTVRLAWGAPCTPRVRSMLRVSRCQPTCSKQHSQTASQAALIPSADASEPRRGCVRRCWRSAPHRTTAWSPRADKVQQADDLLSFDLIAVHYDPCSVL
jgi:hypothetical protein